MSSVGPERLRPLVRAPDAPDVVIVVPYRDRRSYLDIFVELVPRYLDSQGIERFRICVAEQGTAGTFNLALSRDVGALYAICTYRPQYLVFQDVDVIPIRGVDYGPEPTNLTWFLSAGSSKVLTQDFIAVNGYNPSFVGWGSEDSEFGLRLESFGCPVVEWKQRSECAEAMILTLEHPAMSRGDAAFCRGSTGAAHPRQPSSPITIRSSAFTWSGNTTNGATSMTKSASSQLETLRGCLSAAARIAATILCFNGIEYTEPRNAPQGRGKRANLPRDLRPSGRDGA